MEELIEEVAGDLLEGSALDIRRLLYSARPPFSGRTDILLLVALARLVKEPKAGFVSSSLFSDRPREAMLRGLA